MTEKQTSIIMLLVFGLVLLLAAFYTWKVVTNNRNVPESEAPALASLKTVQGQAPYTDIDGNEVYLSDYVGTVLVVNSWASWCPACSAELKKLSEVMQEFEEAEVVALAINRAEPSMTAVSYLKTIDSTGSLKLVLDPSDRYYSSIEGYNMPETVIYDRKGNVVMQKHGAVTKVELKERIAKLLD